MSETNVGKLLEETLKQASTRRKHNAVGNGQFEDVFWPREFWLRLWHQAQAQGGLTGEPDLSEPIKVQTALFTLRLHCHHRLTDEYGYRKDLAAKGGIQ